MKRKTRSFRLSLFVDGLLEQVSNKLGINKTSMIEMSVIEKSQKIGDFGTNRQEAIKCIDEMISSLEMAKNRLK